MIKKIFIFIIIITLFLIIIVRNYPETKTFNEIILKNFSDKEPEFIVIDYKGDWKEIVNRQEIETLLSFFNNCKLIETNEIETDKRFDLPIPDYIQLYLAQEKGFLRIDIYNTKQIEVRYNINNKEGNKIYNIKKTSINYEELFDYYKNIKGE
ncbi:MAG: hypothetical protein FH753_02620 [Firmicutes bacterium]|nr:hypothetical protein [Bacillota bacterium]